MNGEGWLAGLIVLLSFSGIAMAYVYYRRSGDATSVTLLPALIYVCVLYSYTVYIEFTQPWDPAFRVYYRLAQLLQTAAIVMVLLSRIMTDSKKE